VQTGIHIINLSHHSSYQLWSDMTTFTYLKILKLKKNHVILYFYTKNGDHSSTMEKFLLYLYLNQGYIKIHLTTSKSVDMKSIKYPNITSYKQNVYWSPHPACLPDLGKLTILSGSKRTWLPSTELVSKLIQFIWNYSLLIAKYSHPLFYILVAFLNKLA
jgi:hypothetical protein